CPPAPTPPYYGLGSSLGVIFLAISAVFLPPAISHCTSQIAAMAQRIKPPTTAIASPMPKRVDQVEGACPRADTPDPVGDQGSASYSDLRSPRIFSTSRR